MLYEFIYWIRHFFDKEVVDKHSKRVTPADIQAGDLIVVEWGVFRNGIGTMKCLSHDKKTKKVLLIAIDGETENRKVIFPYGCYEFRNFNLLNYHLVDRVSQDVFIGEENLTSLERDLANALADQDFITAAELRDKIKALTVGSMKKV